MANANSIKVTKVMKLEKIKSLLLEHDLGVAEIQGESIDLVSAINHEIDLNIKKAASGKKKKDNSEWENKIIALLGNVSNLTPTEIMAGISAPNTQKVSAVLRGMLLDDKVIKEQKGKVIKYSLAKNIVLDDDTDINDEE